ncbi:Argonaute complex, subunit Arb1 [Diplogelasinospora grovesii]|uniref:Argonaute complex, subunit Arb1 n=1 Tax=Diplogelasinospora grovesii TaxID=303347 RepID=A0AAN6N7L7_9PEZI|nr:Argonaute complex, subunit Arb1 [Diplogelasinospora grovesii]
MVRLGGDKAEEKKKRKRKPASAKNKNKGTGFEAYYCDAPMTPQEAKEEREVIYPPNRAFVDRIEECIQRYRARRRLETDRNNLFSRYLMLGGIDATVRQFQSTSNISGEMLDGLSRDEIRVMTADDVIYRGGGSDHANFYTRWYNPNYPTGWDVDFTGVAAGFFSEELVRLTGGSMADYQTGVEVVANFLRYVVLHDVCPEYADDLQNALKLCDQALDEMPAVLETLNLLPGVFNHAARALFCDKKDLERYEFDNLDVTMREDLDERTARMIFGATIAISSDKNQAQQIAKADLSVTNTFERSYEVVRITPASEAARAKYDSINAHLKNVNQGMRIPPCGHVTVKQIRLENGWDYGPDFEIPDPVPEETFILEEEILQHMRVGMKLTMSVCNMNTGVKFIRQVRDVNPTFYTFLPQELMLSFKEPGMPKEDDDDDDGPSGEALLRKLPVADFERENQDDEQQDE